MTLKTTIAGNDMSDESPSINLDNVIAGLQSGEPDPAEPDEGNDRVEEEFKETVNEKMRELKELCRSMSKKSQDELITDINNFAQRAVKELKPKLQDRTHDGQTILHIFAQEKPTGRTGTIEDMMYKALISYFLMSSITHIGRLDNEHRTPLSVAINKKNYAFILACKMINSEQTIDQIRKALLAEANDDDGGDDTCLDMAVKKQSLPQDVRLELVRLAPKEAFMRPNKRGCTPLHLAVAYNSFEKEPAHQAALVRALLEYGPEAMRVRTPSPNSFSVYQYQEHTRLEKAKKPPQQTEGTTARRGSVRPGRLDQPANMEAPRGTQTPVTMESQEREGGLKAKGPKADEMLGAKGNTGNLSTALDRLKTKVEKEDAQRVVQTPVRLEHANGLSDHDKQFNDIKEELKLWYLRNEQPGDAVKYLTIRGQKRKSFWFDFGHGGPITEADFEAEFKHLELDQSLKYVCFRRGKIKSSSQRSLADESLGGCQDMVFFFSWLRGKKVGRILSVTVEDDGPQIHSDEAIEKAIRGFKVEELDWKKVDLDAGVLQEKHVGDSLREVHLQWSGNNSALRAWGGPSGLRAIPTLKRVYLHARETLDSDQRMKKNLKTFKDLLEAPREKGCPPLSVDYTALAGRAGGRGGTTGKGQPAIEQSNKPGTEQSNNSSTGGGRPVYSHQWITCMDDFVHHFRGIQPKLPPKGPPKLLKPVVVALIDDGVDLPHHASAEHHFNGESFHAYEYGRKMWPWWNSAAGHGTLMARLIHRICPSAVIYVIKLKTQTSEADGSKIHVVPDSAIKAIHHAVEEDVDIISMSWTCAQDQNLQKDWEEAIDAAARKGILMFCSASDSGQFGDRTFPHNCRPNITFRVGAAKPSGQVFDLVADANNLDFALPGYEVFVEGDPVRTTAQSDKLESHTGSSVATALAAGLAALVLEVIRIGLAQDLQKNRNDDTVLVAHDLDLVRDRGTLRRIFLENIGTSKDSALTLNKFIVVDDVFGKYAKTLADDGPDDALDTVAVLAKQLLSGLRPRA